MEKQFANTKTLDLAPSTSSFRTLFASLSLHMSDRLRLLGFPPRITEELRAIIMRYWPQNIQDERIYEGSHEFKLKGYPWDGQGADSVYARRLLCRVLEALANSGWVLMISTDVSKKSTDKDTLLFRLQNPPPTPCEWMCISFSREDRIRFIDAPGDLVQSMIRALTPKIQSHERHKEPGVYELKIRGYPWRANGGETMEVRRMLMTLLEVLEVHGFTVYASIDQKQSINKDTTETDTWHCCRIQGWSPGMPVFHGR